MRKRKIKIETLFSCHDALKLAMEESTLRLAIQGIFRFLAAAEIVIVYGSASNNSRVHEIASSGMA